MRRDPFSPWFIFGTWPDGTVDVADNEGDIITKVPHSVAMNIVISRGEFLKHLATYVGTDDLWAGMRYHGDT